VYCRQLAWRHRIVIEVSQCGPAGEKRDEREFPGQLPAGTWTKKLMPDSRLPLRVTRQVVTWFEPRDRVRFASPNFPVFMIETARGIHYGFPLDEIGLKFAKHHHADEAVDPGASAPSRLPIST
jgi:hypothetical protein